MFFKSDMLLSCMSIKDTTTRHNQAKLLPFVSEIPSGRPNIFADNEL